MAVRQEKDLTPTQPALTSGPYRRGPTCQNHHLSQLPPQPESHLTDDWDRGAPPHQDDQPPCLSHSTPLACTDGSPPPSPGQLPCFQHLSPPPPHFLIFKERVCRKMGQGRLGQTFPMYNESMGYVVNTDRAPTQFGLDNSPTQRSRSSNQRTSHAPFLPRDQGPRHCLKHGTSSLAISASSNRKINIQKPSQIKTIVTKGTTVTSATSKESVWNPCQLCKHFH